jgi:hypothetical protein
MPLDVLAEHLHPARGRQQEAEQDRESRRLAGTVSAEQGSRDATRDRKADPVHRNRGAITLYEVFDYDGRLDHPPYMAGDRAGGQRGSGASGTEPPES